MLLDYNYQRLIDLTSHIMNCFNRLLSNVDTRFVHLHDSSRSPTVRIVAGGRWVDDRLVRSRRSHPFVC